MKFNGTSWTGTVKIEKAIEVSAEYWSGLQSAYDSATARELEHAWLPIAIEIKIEKLNYVLEFYLQLDKEEPDEEKAKAILTQKLKQTINDLKFWPFDHGGSYD